MNLVVSQSIAILPWIFGIFLLYMIMPKYFKINRGFACLMIGAAFLVGYLGLAAQIWLLDQLNFNPISLVLLATTSIVFVMFFIMKSFLNKEILETPKITSESFYNPIFIFTLSFSLIIISYAVHEHFLWPATSWDTVWFWALNANEFLRHIESAKDVTPFTLEGPHPRTLVYIMAWGGWSAAIGEPLRLAPLIPWLHLYLATAVSILGFFLWKTESLTISMVFTYIFLSTPLVEAHTILAGYADLWLAFPVFLSIIFFCEYYKAKDKKLLLLALTIAAIPISIKGVGYVYSIALFGIFLLTPIVNIWNRPITITFFGLLFLSIFSLNLFNIDITLLGDRFAILPETGQIVAGGREMAFSANAWSTVFYNLYIALFFKNSFGIVFFIITASYLYLISLLIFKNKTEFFSQIALFTLLSCLIIAALRYTDYFFSFSFPGGDTSLSRGCMIIFLLGFSLIANAISELSKLEKLDSQN